MIRSVASMRASKSDDAQYQAGRKLRGQFELTEIGSVRAIDSSVEPVDGRGAFVDPITRGTAQADRGGWGAAAPDTQIRLLDPV